MCDREFKAAPDDLLVDVVGKLTWHAAWPRSIHFAFRIARELRHRRNAPPLDWAGRADRRNELRTDGRK